MAALGALLLSALGSVANWPLDVLIEEGTSVSDIGSGFGVIEGVDWMGGPSLLRERKKN